MYTETNNACRILEDPIKVYLDAGLYGRIADDAGSFKITMDDGRPNRNRYINLIVSNYLGQYRAQMDRRFEENLEIIKEECRKETGRVQERAARRLAFKEINRGSESGAHSDRSVAIIIDRDNRPLVGEAINVSFKYEGVSVFLRSLIQSFMSLPVYRREQIIFADRLRIINEAIRMKESVKYKNRETGKCHVFSPAVVGYSMHEYYNYVVGQYVNAYHTIAPVRLATMDCVCRSENSAVFTSDFPMLMKRMLKNGIQFAIQEDRLFRVTLTKEGYDTFSRRYMEQPAPVKKEFRDDGSVVITFDCSWFHLNAYFTPFNGQIIDIE